MSLLSKRLFRVRVPASSANLGPGFDTLGIALNLYLEVDVELSDRPHIVHEDEHMQGLPEDESHLIYKTMSELFDKAKQPMPSFRLTIRSQIPLTRGLGSSASAIVAGLVAANEFLNKPFTQQQLFEFATEEEGHPDNVGASLFGGVVVAQWNGQQVSHIRIEPHSDLEALVIIPQFELETSAARHVLPKHIAFSDAVFNVSHASLLVAALATGDLECITHAMKDKMHEPYRADLVPGMNQILKEAVDHGALGIALSGAGPALLAFVDRRSERKQQLESYLVKTIEEAGVVAESKWLEPCMEGAIVLTPRERNSTLNVD